MTDQIKTAKLLLNAVSFACDLPIDYLVSRRKSAPIVKARQTAMYLIRQETNLTLRETGELLGGRSPATVAYGYQKIAAERVCG